MYGFFVWASTPFLLLLDRYINDVTRIVLSLKTTASSQTESLEPSLHCCTQLEKKHQFISKNCHLNFSYFLYTQFVNISMWFYYTTFGFFKFVSSLLWIHSQFVDNNNGDNIYLYVPHHITKILMVSVHSNYC